MKIKGIKRGQTIQLLQKLDTINDGQEVFLEVSPIHPLSHLTPEERLQRINTILGAWKNQPDLIEIFAEINRERHADYGREIASFDN
jgi:hypothetical protein